MSDLRPVDVEWFGQFLSEDELTVLQQHPVQLSETRTTTVGGVIVAWRLHINKIEAGLPLSDADPKVWGAHDLVAALYLRDFVEGGLAQLDPALRRAVAAAVQEVDDRFRALTDEDVHRELGHVDPVALDDPSWWWRRILSDGPIRREIDAISAAVRGDGWAGAS